MLAEHFHFTIEAALSTFIYAPFISDQFDEDLENNLISYFRPPIGTLPQLITKVCHNLTKYCEGHDKEAERNKKDQVSISAILYGDEVCGV